ncbi:phosphotransferase [Nonomuraea sp. SMC257]|uniref:Phosphotransferase n=1 Tax=Nonomuraea montanisoli TaxID=2741721 RepID=A0A7Y6IEJ5_9ACTN|nr:phosphotransferase [Nonomuraea montanisoli]NUW36824.1 phosphotransferase [Nonomuraea montanisoli]
MIADIRALLARHLPGHEIHSIVRLGEGLDNVVYEIDGELIVRGARVADGDETRRETALLAAVRAISPLPVPEVVFSDPEAAVIAYRKLPGRPVNLHPLPDPMRLAEPLGAFLSALHAAPADGLRELAPPDLYPAPTLLQDAGQNYRDVEEHVPEEQRPLVEAFLRAAVPADTAVLRFCHNDLGAEHLLADPETGLLTGVLDWTDAAFTDPAHDFARVYRDFGPEVFEATAAHYDGGLGEDDRARVRFYARCALIEDLAYGLSTGPRHYADAALANLVRTFS